MSLRLSFVAACGMCMLAPAVHAQVAPTLPITPAFPTPALTVPLVPTPLDEQTQTTLDEQQPRVFQVKLKHVRPSLMAYWLDSKNHEVPFGMTALPSSVKAKDLVLPKGVDRIVAVDPQNALLIFGTAQGVAGLSTTIQFLDRPQNDPSSNVLRTTIEASIYWIDSLAPGAQQWQKTASVPRVALAAELESLSALKAQDRANLQEFPATTASAQHVVPLPFTTLQLSETPKTKRTLPDFHNGREFSSPMPRVAPHSDVDPGIQAQSHRGESMPVTGQDQLLLVPSEITNDSLRLTIAGFNMTEVTLPLRDGDTLLLSGSAQENHLYVPSPRFDTFVVAIKVHVLPPALASTVPHAGK